MCSAWIRSKASSEGSSSDPEEPMLNACDEAAVGYVAIRHGLSVQDVTDKIIAGEEDISQAGLVDSSPHHTENEESEEDSAEEIGESQSRSRQSRPVTKMPVPFTDKNWGCRRSSDVYGTLGTQPDKKWTLVLKETLYCIARNNNWSYTVLQLRKDASLCILAVKRNTNEKGH